MQSLFYLRCNFVVALLLCALFFAEGEKGVIEEVQEYQRLQDGAKLYFKLKMIWNETSDNIIPVAGTDTRPDCPGLNFPKGCVTVEKLATFLHGKWIPGFEASSDPHFVEPGHFFEETRTVDKGTKHREEKKAAAQQAKDPSIPVAPPAPAPIADSPKRLMIEFVNYILSRPEEAVPEQVRKFLLPPGSLWPGSVTQNRDAFLPPIEQRKESCIPAAVRGAPDICTPWREQDIEGPPPSEISVESIIAEEMLEEGELANSAVFRRIFYMAIALMGIIFPTSIFYFAMRSYLNTRDGLRPKSAMMAAPPVSRVDDMRRKLMANAPRVSTLASPNPIFNSPV